MAEDVNPDNLEIADELIAERRSALPGQLPEDMAGWMSTTISVIDSASLWIGKIVSWLLIPLCCAMVYEVVVRKFGIDVSLYIPEIIRLVTGSEAESQVIPKPTMWAYDVSRMLYGAMFMLGAAYALSRGVHIRADFIYRNWSDRTQAIVDTILYLLLYFPAMIMVLWFSVEFAFDTWDRGERAMDTAWMPHLGPIKTVLPVSIFFLIVQGISEVLKCFYAISKGRWPV